MSAGRDRPTSVDQLCTRWQAVLGGEYLLDIEPSNQPLIATKHRSAHIL